MHWSIYADGKNDYEYYSTSEVLTKKIWTDGKPIYRKVYNATVGTLTNVDTIVSVSGVARVYWSLSGWNWTTLGNYAGFADSYKFNSYFIRINEGKTSFDVVNAGTGGNPNISNCTVILEYTKT